MRTDADELNECLTTKLTLRGIGSRQRMLAVFVGESKTNPLSLLHSFIGTEIALL